MPRGKRTVYGGYCPECGDQVGTYRFHRQNSKGVAWRDNKLTKFCPSCGQARELKLREMKHSS